MNKLIAVTNIKLGDITPPTEAFSVGSSTEAGALSNLELFISNVIGFITTLGTLFFIVYFVMAAFNWITSGGDKGKLDSARNQMVNGVIGLILIVASYGIIGVIGTIVGLNLLNPAEVIQTIIPK